MEQGLNYLKWLLFSPKGRLNRYPFWIYGIIVGILAYLLSSQFIISDPYPHYEFNIFTVGSLALLWVISILVSIKRCYDRGRSGFFLLLLFAPSILSLVLMVNVGLIQSTFFQLVLLLAQLASLWPLVELLFFRGTIGDNKYGKDPLGESTPTENIDTVVDLTEPASGQAEQVQNATPDIMQYYGQAEEEVNKGTMDKGLWALALVKVKGNESERKAEYISRRARQLQQLSVEQKQ